MENPNQNENNNPEVFNQTPVNNEPKGPTIGIIIIVLILILGGVYVFMNYSNGLAPEDSDPTEEALLQQDTSIELEDIERDALDTDLEGLDAELEAIERELENL